MNKESFLKFACQNPVGELLLDQIRPLHRRLESTTLEQIEEWSAQKMLRLERGEIIRAVKDMDGLNLARFVVGRRGAPSRIEWLFDTSDLEDVSTANGASEFGATGKKSESEEQAGLIVEAIEHVFRVRPDFSVTLTLPSNFTTLEAERLSAFIKTLPFE